MARLASDPEFAGVTAKYYSIDVEMPSSAASYDEAKQAEVWEYSEALVEKLLAQPRAAGAAVAAAGAGGVSPA